MTPVTFSVSDFVGALNQTLEIAYPNVIIVGELSNFKISKNRWIYFDLKDEYASVRFFGTVYQLPGPVEDGMMVQVRGNPRLHPQFGFSVTVQSLQPVGEGSIKKAAALLQAKLTAEGLFDEDRKRPIPYPPAHVGLITSEQSAAYADFSKIMSQRWGGVKIDLADVQVQGEVAPQQIVEAIEFFNSQAHPPEVLVITRGGGAAEDLAAFSTEQVTRAVAASRIPTLVAIGHEIDVSLAELAADRRASTPSNAAEILVPDRRHELAQLTSKTNQLGQLLGQISLHLGRDLISYRQRLHDQTRQIVDRQTAEVSRKRQLLEAYNPQNILQRGYAVVYQAGKAVTTVKGQAKGGQLSVRLQDGTIETVITKVS